MHVAIGAKAEEKTKHNNEYKRERERE